VARGKERGRLAYEEARGGKRGGCSLSEIITDRAICFAGLRAPDLSSCAEEMFWGKDRLDFVDDGLSCLMGELSLK